MTNIFRKNGWTCRECGFFNGFDSYSCDGDECRDNRKREENRDLRAYVRRGLIHRYRQQWERDGDPTRLLARSDGGMLYRVRRFAGRRVGLTYTVLVPGGYAYRVDRYRAPSSVVRQACLHFFGVDLGTGSLI